MMHRIESLKTIAKNIDKLLISDRDVISVVGGMTGEGKSTFMGKLMIEYEKLHKKKWSFDNITWSREELETWIDGDDKGKKQKPEYEAILVDELISLFFKRNWYESPQKGAIELLNKCRDRHLFIGGNIPNFWDLDSSFLSRIRFYFYIPLGRGKAWMFQQEDNPFTNDKWNVNENRKIFRKKKSPYRCPNFVCEIRFDDFTIEEKKKYLQIRNTKRKNTEQQSKRQRIERYGKIKQQRDLIIRELFKSNEKLTNSDVSDILHKELSSEAIRLIRVGAL